MHVYSKLAVLCVDFNFSANAGKVRSIYKYTLACPRLAHHSLFMTDLTILHAPSTLSLPDTKETGLRFAFNRRSLTPRPLISTPMVTVQMVETDSPPPSPVGFQDHSLLSPPRRSFRSKDSHRVTRTRPSSAPPGKPRTISPHDHFPSRPKSPDFVSGSHSSIPVVVRPETTLCTCIVSWILRPVLTFPSPSEAVLEEHPTLCCFWDILRIVPSSYSSFNVYRCRSSFRQTHCGSVCLGC